MLFRILHSETKEHLATLEATSEEDAELQYYETIDNEYCPLIIVEEDCDGTN